MKVCPQCQKTYDDDSLNFCLEDGTVLTLENSAYEEAPETVFVNQPAQTTPNSPFGEQTNWQNTPKTEAKVKSGSKAWMWAIGVLLAGLILCGGGGVVSLLILSNLPKEPPPKAKDRTTTETVETPENNDDIRKFDKRVNFNDINFKNTKFITIEKTANELELTCVDGYFYVIAFEKSDSENSTISLNVKNPSGKMTKSGFGVVFHSDPNKALRRDYAFVIDSNKGKYRFVSHKDTKETEIIGWKRTSAIRRGTRENKLEVKIYKKEAKLYINDEFIKTVKIKTTYRNNVAGVYTSDDIPITFSDMEIRR